MNVQILALTHCSVLQILKKVDADGDSELNMDEFVLFVEVSRKRLQHTPAAHSLTHILFVVQVCQAIDAHMVKQDLSAGEVAPDTKGETETQSTDAAEPDSESSQVKEQQSLSVGFFKGKALPKRVKNKWDPLPHETEEEAQIRWQKNEWDGIGHAEGPVVTSYDRPDLGHGKAVHRDINAFEMEQVKLKKMQESQDDGYGDFDPQVVQMFKMLDANNSKTVEVSELIASMKDIRDALGLQHPSSIGDITKVSCLPNCWVDSDIMLCGWMVSGVEQAGYQW